MRQVPPWAGARERPLGSTASAGGACCRQPGSTGVAGSPCQGVPKNLLPPWAAMVVPRELPRLLPAGRAEFTPGCPARCSALTGGGGGGVRGEEGRCDHRVSGRTGERCWNPPQFRHILWLLAELPPSTPPSTTAHSWYGGSWRNQAGAPRSLGPPRPGTSWSDDISPEGQTTPSCAPTPAWSPRPHPCCNPLPAGPFPPRRRALRTVPAPRASPDGSGVGGSWAKQRRGDNFLH